MIYTIIRKILILGFDCLLLVFIVSCGFGETSPVNGNFQGKRAMKDIVYQLSLGPRIPGSVGHQKLVDWLVNDLPSLGWVTEFQSGNIGNHPVQNVIAQKGTGSAWIVIGAHYDSRIYADRDENNSFHSDPVPGANDGASGVAILMELARSLPEKLNKNVWLVFFDIEDNGNIPGWDWVLGSTYFANQLQHCPDAVVIVDMVGDKDLQILREKRSDPNLTDEIWEISNKLGYSRYFIDQVGYTVLDDHVPFIEAGCRAIDVIDINYPYWHTTADTIDKVSEASLQVVGDTLFNWIIQP
jgi:glutaminyl-peptide cyclotransferase